MANRSINTCPCCGRKARLTFHHLIPKKMHRRSYFRKKIPKERLQQGVLLCRQCHDGIHRTYDEMTLAKQLNNLESLLKDETLQRHFRWVGKQQINVK